MGGEDGGQDPVGDLGADVAAGAVLDGDAVLGQQGLEHVPDGAGVDRAVGVDLVHQVVGIDEVGVEAAQALALLGPGEQAALIAGALLEGDEVGEQVGEALVVGAALGRVEELRGLLVEDGVAVLVDDARGVLALVDAVGAHAEAHRGAIPLGVVDQVGVDGLDQGGLVAHGAEAEAFELLVGQVDPVVGHGVLEAGAGPARGPGAVGLDGGLDGGVGGLGVDVGADEATALGIVQVLEWAALEHGVGLAHRGPPATSGVDRVGDEEAGRRGRAGVAGVAAGLDPGGGGPDGDRHPTGAPRHPGHRAGPVGGGRRHVEHVAAVGVDQHPPRPRRVAGGHRHGPGQGQLGTGGHPHQLGGTDLLGHAVHGLGGVLLGLGLVDGILAVGGLGPGQGVVGALHLAVGQDVDHQLGALHGVVVDVLGEGDVDDGGGAGHAGGHEVVPLLVGELGVVGHPGLGRLDRRLLLGAQPLQRRGRGGRRVAVATPVVITRAGGGEEGEGHDCGQGHESTGGPGGAHGGRR